ncbi:hypothetical protein BaRGS_00009851, partial [Batillaria attramentaria]
LIASKGAATHDKKELCRICNELGDLLFENGSFEKSICEFQHAKEIHEVLQDTIGAAVACRKIGDCYCNMEQYDKALQFQYQHLTLAQQCKDQVETQRALATLGRTYLCQAETQNQGMRISSLERAEKMFLKALDVCMSLKDTCGLSLTEQMAMRGRVYLNLGLVWDARGVEKETGDYLQKALTISEKYALEEVQYLCHYNLAGIYVRSSKPAQALRSLELALELAGKLHSMSKEREVFIQMALTNLHAGNAAAAKHCLKKAYKVTSGADESARIIKLFKAAVTIEEVTELFETSAQDDRQLFEAHEKLGDAFSDAGIFKMAISHYKKMLDCGQRLGCPAEQLIPAYVSLAQTYADNCQPDDAISNYHFELELRGDDHVQKCKTWLNVAEQEEFRGDDYKHLSRSYMAAFSCAKRANSPKLQVRVLKALVAVQTAFNEKKHLAQTQRKLAELQAKYSLGPESDASDEESELADATANSCPEDLNDLTSSDDDLEEAEASSSAPACIRYKKTFKVNEKGETPLHVACIKGNLKKVRSLLSEGHPVNVRDNCGWTPLHEAANHDHKALVELLLDAGADINDRGGELCNGITPLIDAASCGNMDVVQLLIKRGANTLAKDTNGSTALRSLQDWYARTAETLEEDSLQQYKEILHLLKGEKTETHSVVEKEVVLSCDKSQANTSSRKRFPLSSPGTQSPLLHSPTLLRHADNEKNGDKDWGETFSHGVLEQYGNENMNAADTYRNTMLALGSSTQRSNSLFHFQSLTSPPLPPAVTRVKVRIGESVLLIPLPWFTRTTRQGLREDDDIIVEDSAVDSTQAGSTKRKHSDNEASAADSDEDSAYSPPEEPSTSRSKPKLQGIVQGWDQPPLSQRYAQACSSLNAVRYKNISRMLQDAESSHILCLRGLALSHVVFLSVTKTLQGQANIRELHLPCNNIGDLGLESLVKVLPDLTNLQVLNLACNNITSTGLAHLTGLLKTTRSPSGVSTVARQIPLQALTSLDISNNPFGCGSGFASSLCEILTTLPSLVFLSLSACELTPKLFQHSGLALTTMLRGHGLQELDISYNHLEALGVELLLRSLRSSQVTRLNLGHTMVNCNHLTALLQPFLSLRGAVLQTLCMDNCIQNCQREDLDLMCRLPVICPSLQCLHLSFNRQVTLPVLQRLLCTSADCSDSHLQELVAVGCSVVSPVSSDFCDALTQKLTCDWPLKCLIISCQGCSKMDREVLSHLWRDTWSEAAAVHGTEQIVSLTVCKSP